MVFLYIISEEKLWEDHSAILIRSSKVGKMILFGSVIVVYVLNDPTAVWLVLMYFDPYNGSSYMIQVVFCPYVYVKEKYSMTIEEFLLQASGKTEWSFLFVESLQEF